MRDNHHLSVYVPDQNASFLNASGASLRRTSTISRDRSPAKVSIGSKEEATIYQDSPDKATSNRKFADVTSKGSGKALHETSDGNSSTHAAKFRSITRAMTKDLTGLSMEQVEPLLREMQKYLKSRLGQAMLKVVAEKSVNPSQLIKDDDFDQAELVEQQTKLSQHTGTIQHGSNRIQINSGNGSGSAEIPKDQINCSQKSQESHQLQSDR